MNDLTATQAKEITPFTRPSRGCGNEAGAKLAKVLIGSYPKEPHEPEVYTRAIVSVLAEQPIEIAKEAVDRVTRKLKFLPTRADVCEAIEAVNTEIRRRSIEDRARLEMCRQREQWDRDDAVLAADRKRVRDILGPAHDDWFKLPAIRMYAAPLEDFRAGWDAATDKAAFCDSWGATSGEAA